MVAPLQSQIQTVMAGGAAQYDTSNILGIQPYPSATPKPFGPASILDLMKPFRIYNRATAAKSTGTGYGGSSGTGSGYGGSSGASSGYGG